MPCESAQSGTSYLGYLWRIGHFFVSFLWFDLCLDGLIHSRNVPRFLGVLVELIYRGDKGLEEESIVGLVGVGAIIDYRSVCFPSLYGVSITHSVVFITFRTR